MTELLILSSQEEREKPKNDSIPRIGRIYLKDVEAELLKSTDEEEK